MDFLKANLLVPDGGPIPVEIPAWAVVHFNRLDDGTVLLGLTDGSKAITKLNVAKVKEWLGNSRATVKA